MTQPNLRQLKRTFRFEGSPAGVLFPKHLPREWFLQPPFRICCACVLHRCAGCRLSASPPLTCLCALHLCEAGSANHVVGSSGQPRGAVLEAQRKVAKRGWSCCAPTCFSTTSGHYALCGSHKSWQGLLHTTDADLCILSFFQT